MKQFRQTAFYRNLHYFIFIAFTGFYLVKLNDVCTRYNLYGKVLNEDAFGYYVILPALLKYDDPHFTFLDSSVRKLPENQYIPPVVNQAPNGKQVCKYYAGVALLQLPFYLAGNVMAKIRGQSVGFENTYQVAILLSVVFYLFMGLLQTLKILMRIGIQPIVAALLVPLIVFGTNLYCYTTHDMAYSHVYSFFALVFFIHFLLQLKAQFSTRHAIFCGLFYGLILLIRPLNGIAILFVPLIFSLQEFRSFFSRRHIDKTVLIGLCVLCMLSIQSLLWYWQTGLFYVYPYGEEKLNLLNPHLIELVFGFDCGWAIYTPLPFLMLLFALYMLWRKRQYKKFVWATVCSISILYLLSCWYYLHYGCTVGCRPITEFYGPITILFGFACVHLFRRKWFKLGFFSLAYLLVYYNQVIHYQFYENILNWCHMDKTKFRMVFMKTDPAYQFSTAEFWDFSGFGKSRDTLFIPVNKTLHIDREKTIDTLNIRLPAIGLNDSGLLLNIHFKCRMEKDINESFIRLLMTENGAYIDLQYFLLKRKVNTFDQVQDVHYEFLITKPLPSCTMHFSLESTDEKAITKVDVVEILVNRVKAGNR